MGHKKIEDIGGYPSPLASKAVKDSKAFGLKYFKKMYSEWDGGNNSNLLNKRRRYRRARAYAAGTQSIEKFKTQLSTSGDEAYMNLDWETVGIVNKFVDVIVNGLVEQEYEMTVTAIDRTSLNKRVKDRGKFFINMLNVDYNKEFAKKSGMPEADRGFTPATSEELDLYMDLNYKQKNEIAMEVALSAIKALNDYDEVRQQVLKDLVALNLGVAKTITDPKKGIRIEYVDPANFIYSKSNSPDCKKVVHAGEIKYLTLGEIRRMSKPGDLTEEDLKKIADNVKGEHSNPTTYSTEAISSDLGYDEYEFDSFTIPVLDGVFKSDYNLVYEKKENRHGGENIYRKEDTYKLPKRSKYKRELVKENAAIYYKGLYIIGTDYLLNYEVAKNMIRKKSTLDDTPIPYIIYQIEGKSLVERMMPFADQIQLVHLKMQLMIAKARPKGVAIELRSMENVAKGDGATFTPLELQDIYDQTGNFYYRNKDDDGTPGSARPITELTGGIGSEMQNFIALYNHNMQLIRDVTGVNEARDATQPSSKALIGTQKLALIASNNATRHINTGELNISRRVAEHCMLRLQDVINYSPLKKKYVAMLGEAVMESISMGKDFHLNEFGLVITLAPDEAERQVFESNVQMSLQQKELRLEDAIFVRSINNVKLANQSLVIRRKKYQEEQAEQMQAQQQAEMQKIQAQQQAEMQKIQAEAAQEFQMKEKLEMLSHENEMERLQLEYDLKMKLKGIENTGLKDKEQVKVDGNKDVQTSANQGKMDLQSAAAPVDPGAQPEMPFGEEPGVQDIEPTALPDFL